MALGHSASDDDDSSDASRRGGGSGGGGDAKIPLRDDDINMGDGADHAGVNPAVPPAAAVPLQPPIIESEPELEVMEDNDAGQAQDSSDDEDPRMAELAREFAIIKSRATSAIQPI